MSWKPTRITAERDAPLHVQVRRSIKEALNTGALPPGERLPGVRTMADAFGVNRLTVLKAIGFLVAQGTLASIQGRGVYASSKGTSGTAPTETSDRNDSFFEGVAEGAQTPWEDHNADPQIGRFVRDCLVHEAISFAAGFPPEEIIPTETIRGLAARLLQRRVGSQALGYSPPEGDPAFIAEIRRLLEKRGLHLTSDDCIIVTAGAQQAISLCLERFVRHVGALAIESPGYMGVIAACRMGRIPMVPVPVDSGGINLARLAQALKHGDVAGIYTVPSYQNPTGVTQLKSRREKLLALANAHGAVILEDDIYADLRLGGRAIVPIKSLPGGERVIYVGSFSKSVAPGLRIGFMVATGDRALDLLHFKETVDISTGRFSQAILAELLRSGGYTRHLMRVRREYKKRRDAMIDALEAHLPASARITRPKGGMHIWVMLEKAVDMDRLEVNARESGVLFAPGSLFFTDDRRASSLRLNFSAHPPEIIREGIKRLSRCIRKELAS